MGQLNDLQIKAAQPLDKEYLLADGEGLYLRVRPTAKVWVYRYKQLGKEAKLIRRAALQQGTVHLRGVEKHLSKMESDELSQANLQRLRGQVKRLEASLEKKREVPRTQGTTKGALAAVNAILSSSLQAQKALPMIMHGQLRSQGKIVDGKHVGRSKRVLSETELSLFLPWIESGMRQLQRDITLMYLFTGMRGVEIIGLRSEYVTEEHDGWWATIPIHVLKMERDMDIVDHRVPLVGRALEIVTRRLERAHDGWLFWTDRGKVLRPYSQKVFSTFCYDIQPNHSTVKAKRPENEICPVTGWTPHDLRRTTRTLLGSIDCPQEIGESIIGHKPKEMVATYNLHTYDRQKR